MKRLFYLSILVLIGLMPIVTGCGESKADREARIKTERERQDSIRMERERAERLEKERLEKERLEKERLEAERLELARLEAEREAKKWKGASSLSEFKSKLPGTIWGATRKRGDFYFKFRITDNKIIVTAHINSDLGADSQFGEPKVKIIDSWKELDKHNGFTVIACEEGADKDFSTILGFVKGQSDALWGTMDGTIPLKQIIE